MKNRIFSCVMLFICTMTFVKIDANECHDALLDEIIAIDATCILGRIGEKVYLNPEKIIPSDQGLFLNLQNENYLPLQMIYSDENGCYITPMLSMKTTNTCPNCGQEYTARCRNPDCSGNKKIEQAEEDKKKKKEDAKKSKQEEKNKKE